ncbi:MAG: radical SAM protein [Theionarchaea archaeon]|nr:radical SAM protein [Theionarchaea archaeon]
MIEFNKYCACRREHFGGLMINADASMFFINEKTLQRIEKGDIDDPLMQYLTNAGMIPGEKKSMDYTPFQLKAFEFDDGCTHLSAPITACIEVTHACNLNCPHCLFAAGKKHPDELTTEEIKALYDEWADMKVFKVNISGGEPFMREDIVEILNYGDEVGLQQYVVTNATLVTEDDFQVLPRSVRYGVSLDGFEESHDKIRGKGSFARTTEVLEMFLREETKFGINFTLSQINKGEAERLMAHWLNRGIKVSLNPVLPFGRSSEHQKQLWLRKEDAHDFIRIRELKIRRVKSRDRKLYGGPHPLHVDDMPELFQKAFLACEGSRTDVWVRFDGNVYPCADTAALEEFCMGNLRDTSFKEIWENGKGGTAFRQITKDSFSECKTCDVEDVCNFRCAALSHSMFNDFCVCGASDFIKEVLRIARKKKITDRIFFEGN